MNDNQERADTERQAYETDTMTETPDSRNVSEADEDERGTASMKRRRFMQASGAGAVGVLGVNGVANERDLVASATQGPGENAISVLMMGGPTDGSHNAPARQVQITEYLLNRGIEVQYTDRLEDLAPDTLHDYDAWIMFDNRGANYGESLPEDLEQSIVDFVENGGGFVPIHSASACFTESDAYLNLVGGQFADHNIGEMTTTYAQPDHPILSTLEPFTVEDETYRHTNLNDDINVLTYGQFPEGDSIPEYDEGREQGEPWSWTRTQGDGRVFYTAWGHGRAPWAEPGFKNLIENALRWVTGNEDTIAEDTRVLDELEFLEADIPYYPPPEGSLLPTTVPDEVGEGTDWQRMQGALDPEGTMERTILPEGFELEPFVTEAMLPEDLQGNILDARFDEQGRAWLIMSRDYPNSLGEGSDEIVICEDTDGDGVADDFTVFASGLSIPPSMVLVEDGVIVAHLEEQDDAGKVERIVDTDGDDQADERTVLFSGFGTGDTHAGPNELVHGIDNWIWGQVGYEGFSGTIAGEQREFASSLYRFKLGDEGEVTDFEIAGELPGNQAGLDFTEEGLVFASAATSGRPSNYFPIPYSYYELINGTGPTDFGMSADTNRFLPVTDRVRQVDRHGGFTAATGHTIYTARDYPEKYWNSSAFVGDGTGHLLSTFFLEQNGADYDTHYAHNIAGSTDAWFAPSYSSVGPDGMMWFVDWYNYIYQHNPTPEGRETGPGNAYISELRDHASSRLFRVTYGDASGYDPADLSDASQSELVDALANDNKFWRDKAQRMLVERDALGAVGGLVDLVENESVDDLGLDPGAIHALWTLDGLGALEPGACDPKVLDAALGALTHPSAGVRITALRVLPKNEETRGAILDNGLITDDDKRVAMWALVALAQTPESEAAGEAVYEMISTEPNFEDDILVDAASLAGAQHASGFVPVYEANEDTDTDAPDPSELPNLFQNPSMEDPASGSGPMPEGWSTMTYNGNATHTYATTGSDGERSVQIQSDEGADASWQVTASVETDTEYTLSGMVRTESLELVDGSGFGEGPLGASFNIEQIANTSSGTQWDTIPEGLTGTNDWTELSVTVNSGSNEELLINALFGGYGQATGSAWFDNVTLTDPDGNNVLSNPSMETEADTGGDAEAPAVWEPITYGGSAEFIYTSDVSRTGEDSVAISSEEGADASWTQTMDGLDPNSEYRFRAWVRTSDDFSNSEDGFGEIGSSYGVTLNVGGVGEDSVGNYFTEPIDGWQMLETTFQTSGGSASYDLNLLYGAYGNATGTVWFDDAELKKIGGFGGGLQLVYDRVTTHVEMASGDGDDGDDSDDGGSEAIDPSTTIELVVESNEAWTGVTPASIEGTDNPTLTLEADAEYTVTWTNENGAPHNFEIVDENDEVLQEVSTDYLATQGESQTVTFTATDDIAEYVCRAHPTRMRAPVELAGGSSE